MTGTFHAPAWNCSAATAVPDATFRDGQFEVIRSLINSSSRLLVVQRTGWGKSMVYLIATRILRRQGGRAPRCSPPLACPDAQPDAGRSEAQAGR